MSVDGYLRRVSCGDNGSGDTCLAGTQAGRGEVCAACPRAPA